MRRYFILLLVVLVSGCQNQEGREINLYFDIEKKIESILEQLEQHPNQLYKTAQMNESIDSGFVVMDSTGWSREMEIFSAANINKIQYQGVYSIMDRPDENSNLEIKRYEHSEPEEASVPWMEVAYLDSLENCRSIKLVYQEENAGFAVYRHMELEFEEIRNSNFLKSYHITGFQKIFGQDTVKFNIRGELSY